MPSSTIPRGALVLLVVLAFFWGINWPILKIALRELPVFWFRFVCTIFGGIGLMMVAKGMGYSLKVPRNLWLHVTWVALGAVTGWNVFSALGIKLLPSGRASMLGYTLPIWVALLSLIFLREKPTPRVLAGLVLGMMGVALFIGEDMRVVGTAPWGTLAMMAAAFTWAIALILLKHRPTGLPPSVQTAWMMLIGGVPITIIAAFDTGLMPPKMSQDALLALLYNVFVAGIFCYWAFYKLAEMLPANVTAISSLLVPVVGFLAGMIWLGETPSVREWAAVGLILGALVVVLLLPERKNVNDKPQ